MIIPAGHKHKRGKHMKLFYVSKKAISPYLFKIILILIGLMILVFITSEILGDSNTPLQVISDGLGSLGGGRG